MCIVLTSLSLAHENSEDALRYTKGIVCDIYEAKHSQEHNCKIATLEHSQV